MKQGAHEAFAACIGIDWADRKHDVCLQAAGAEPRECCSLTHTPEAIDAWVSTLRTRCNGQPIALCLELNQGPIVSALRTYDFLVLFPINPLTLARYREAFPPSRAKDDPTDAALQLALLLTHRDKLHPLTPQSPTRRALAQLVAHRRRVVGDTVRITNRLTRTLKNYFPHVLHWFQEKDPAIFCDFLSRWPTLKAVQLARRATLETCFRTHHVRYAEVITQRIEAIKAAIPLTTDDGVIAPHALLVQALVAQLRVTLQAIADFDTAIAQYAQSPPDFPLFQALPGAGPVFAPRLLVACGEQRERSASAAELQKYAGIAPVTERRGKKLGCTGASSARSASDTRSSNGRPSQSGMLSGHSSTPSRNVTRAQPLRPPCGPWRAHGSASCIAVGRSVRRTRSPSISRRLNDGGHR